MIVIASSCNRLVDSTHQVSISATTQSYGLEIASPLLTAGVKSATKLYTLFCYIRLLALDERPRENRGGGGRGGYGGGRGDQGRRN